MSQIQIRPARIDDAKAMIHIHHAAVHGLAATCYSAEILEAWSRKPDEARYRWMEGMIADERAMLLVAEQSGRVAGFCILLKAEGLLRALYVHPDAGRTGCGSALLRAAENHAAAAGLASIEVNSSLNAEGFYRRHGYVVVAKGKLRLSEQHEMDCIAMRKLL